MKKLILSHQYQVLDYPLPEVLEKNPRVVICSKMPTKTSQIFHWHMVTFPQEERMISLQKTIKHDFLNFI